MGSGSSPTGGATLGNKDGPAFFVKYNAGVSNVTIQYVHIDGGWIYDPASTDHGCGFSYAGGSLQAHNNGDLPAAGRWRENLKFLHLHVERTRGTLYLGPNFGDAPSGVLPLRNIEVAYCRFCKTGSGASEGKCWFEGDNSYHHNIAIACGAADYTNFRGGFLILSGTGKVYNNWIQDIGQGATTWSGGGQPNGTYIYIQNGPVAAVKPWGLYGPYTVFDYEVYNNVIMGCGNPGVTVGSGIAAGKDAAERVTPRAKIYNNTVSAAPAMA